MNNLRQKSIENLFVSKVRFKALEYFMLNPTVEIHLRGAVREFKEEINAVRRELVRLTEVKILNEKSVGNRKYYNLNMDHPFITELMGIFHKSFGLGGQILSSQNKIGEVNFAILTPAFTRGSYFGSQTVDLLIVGNIEMKILSEIIQNFEKTIGREIHYAVLKPSELDLRKRRRDQFIIDLVMQNNIYLLGKHEDFIK